MSAPSTTEEITELKTHARNGRPALVRFRPEDLEFLRGRRADPAVAAQDAEDRASVGRRYGRPTPTAAELHAELAATYAHAFPDSEMARWVTWLDGHPSESLHSSRRAADQRAWRWELRQIAEQAGLALAALGVDLVLVGELLGQPLFGDDAGDALLVRAQIALVDALKACRSPDGQTLKIKVKVAGTDEEIPLEQFAANLMKSATRGTS